MKEDLFSFFNIYRCYHKCRKGKSKTINALRFDVQLSDNLCRLENELKSRIYQPARSVCFLAKKPKLREIFAADFRDRVVHHILVDYPEKIFEPIFSYDSWACRKNKGTHGAVERLTGFVRRITGNGTKTAYYLQLDSRSFFVSIDKHILMEQFKKKVSHPDALWLLKKIIFQRCTENYIFRGNRSLAAMVPAHKTLFKSEPQDKGLPIGNLTSQFFANVYLNALDQFVKHSLKCKYYLRYVDDFVLLCENEAQLREWKERIETFLSEALRLRLNAQRERLRPVAAGIDFLGYIIKTKYRLVRKRVVNNCKYKLKELEGKVIRKSNFGFIEEYNPVLVRAVNDCIASYFAHFKYAQAAKLKETLKQRFPFIEDFANNAVLVAPRYFPNLRTQYAYFKDFFSRIMFHWDSGGQGYFEPERLIMFFRVGSYYRFYGQDAEITAMKILRLNIPRGKDACFPLALENVYAQRALFQEYSVAVCEEKKFRFTHRLRTRVLTRKYCAGVFAGTVPRTVPVSVRHVRGTCPA